MTAPVPNDAPDREAKGGRRAAFEWLAFGVLVLLIALRLRLWTLVTGTLSSILPAHGLSPALDFFQDWAAARDQMAGLGMYQPLKEAFRRHSESMGTGRWDYTGSLVVNGHPPSMILFIMPLAMFSFLTAFRIWSLLGLLSIFASLTLLIGSLWPRLRWPARAAIAVVLEVLLLTSAPIGVQFSLGNIQAILLLVLTLIYVCDRSGRPLLAGTFLGIAGATKFYPLVLLLYFVLRKDWRAIGMTAAVFVGIQLVVLAAFGRASFDEFQSKGVPAVVGTSGYNSNISLAGYWTKVLRKSGELPEPGRVPESPALARAAQLLSSAAIVGAIVVCWVRYGEPDRAPLLFAAASIAMMLLAPVMWDHGLILTIMPVAILLRHLPPRGPSLWILRATMIVLWLPTVQLIKERMRPVFPDMERFSRVEVLTYASIPTYCLLALMAITLVAMAANPSTSAPARSPNQPTPR